MGFFDDKPKKKGGLFDSKYEPDAWRKDIPYNDTHDSHIWDWDAPDKDGDGNSWVSMNCVHWMLGYSEPIEDFWEMLGLGHTYNLRYDLQKCH
jgi:hypothetical protein